MVMEGSGWLMEGSGWVMEGSEWVGVTLWVNC